MRYSALANSGSFNGFGVRSCQCAKGASGSSSPLSLFSEHIDEEEKGRRQVALRRRIPTSLLSLRQARLANDYLVELLTVSSLPSLEFEARPGMEMGMLARVRA